MGVSGTPSPVIQVSGIRKSYGTTVAASELSFNVSEGEVFGLIGPNGAGKTTTMECVEGVRRPDAGQISIMGLDPFRDVYQVQNRIGVQLQQAQLQKRIKVWEAVDLWASLYPKSVDADRLLEQLGLSESRNSWFMTLSGGQKQRLFIALALINDPEVVFLDELTTGLDPQSRRAIWDLVRGIRDRGKTVFMTTHLMEEAERLCDRVAIIEHGKIIDIGRPEELVGRHCPARTVVLASDNALAEQHLRAMPQVESVMHEGSQFTIQGMGAEFVSVELPVLVAVLIALSGVLSLVTIISIYREGGILKRLRATPLRPQTILTAHVLVKLALTAVTLALTLLAGKRYYPINMNIPIFGFTMALLISTWSILSIGFVIASIVPTARFAQPIGAAILYPMVGLCGLFVPLQSLPPALQAVSRVLPLTYAVSLLQGIWKGEAWWAHRGDVVALIVVFVICTALSAKVFRWE